MLKNLLVYRLVIVNLLWLLFLGYAQTQGWVERVIAGDHTGIIWICVAFFAYSLWSTAIRAGKVSKCLNALKDKQPLNINPVKFVAKGAHLNELPGWIMLVGLTGNVIGIMLSIESANLGAGDPQQSIVGLLSSMGVAFSATIASGVLALWAMINGQILNTATVCMLEDAKS